MQAISHSAPAPPASACLHIQTDYSLLRRPNSQNLESLPYTRLHYASMSLVWSPTRPQALPGSLSYPVDLSSHSHHAAPTKCFNAPGFSKQKKIKQNKDCKNLGAFFGFSPAPLPCARSSRPRCRPLNSIGVAHLLHPSPSTPGECYFTHQKNATC